MKLENLHIISFNVPYPADYGGVIDVFYRIKALHQQGVKITLHSFDYGRGEQEELEKYCEKVFYYKRSLSIVKQFSKLPFIIETRKNEELLKNLLVDDFPIWFEGIHTTAYLSHQRLKSRRKFVRCHNIEHHYYEGLARAEKNILLRAYYHFEAKRLKNFESILKYADALFCISEADQIHFQQYVNYCFLLPAFIEDFTETNPKASIENYALYHGNLEVAENEMAVLFLAEVFRDLDMPLWIAGKSPRKKLKRKVNSLVNVKWIENPSQQELNRLIQQARLNCLPAFQVSGIKLKLIHALALGNQVLVNPTMVQGNDLKKYCIVADGVLSWREEIRKVFRQNLSREDIQIRQQKIQKNFDSNINSLHLMEWLAEVR